MSAHIESKRPRIHTFFLRVGPVSHLALFFWALGMVMLAPAEKLVWAAAACLLVGSFFYPRSFRRLLRLRYLIMLAALILPTLFLLGEIDHQLWGIGYSSEGLLAAMQIGLRFVVVLMAIDGFTSAVDIPQMAGLLERFGLRGLGFSMGVALNLLPELQQASQTAWQALQMRGGLRRQWWRGLRLLTITIITNALRRAEGIALAAEARAFSPEYARPQPLQSSWQDKLLLSISMVSLLVMVLW